MRYLRNTGLGVVVLLAVPALLMSMMPTTRVVPTSQVAFSTPRPVVVQAVSMPAETDTLVPARRPQVSVPLPTVKVRPLARIAPGTVVPEGPPLAWTHLVYKYGSELASGDLDRIPVSTFKYVDLLSNVCVARVLTVGSRYQLDEIAVGLTTRLDGQDVVISSDTLEQQGFQFSTVQRAVLAAAEARFDDYVCVAKSESFALVDIPSIILRDGEHVEAVIRHAFLADPVTGTLETIVWLLNVDRWGRYTLAHEPAVQQTPGLIETSPLHVDARQFIFGIPRARGFAVTRMPAGKPYALPEIIHVAAAARVPTAEEARAIHRALGAAEPPQAIATGG